MAPLPADQVQLEVLFDNESCHAQLTSLWGFSALIKTPQKSFLFDTGSNGRVLLQNLRTQGLRLDSVDALFISHAHWDHIGGLDSVLEEHPHLPIYATAHLSSNLIRDLNQLSGGVHLVGDHPTAITPHIYSTGAMGAAQEQSMVIQTDAGLIIITGCGHSGIEAIVQRAKSIWNQEILLLLGGFHLHDKSPEEIETIITHLQANSTRYLCPSHCTGATAHALFAQAFGAYYLHGGVGMQLRFRGRELHPIA